jgi:RNA polymerase sigma-70 factor (ECF subfamily)
MIEEAAAGSAAPREMFARRYAPVITAYLAARWSDGPRRSDLDDAVQEVFLECFRSRGALARVDRDRPGGFRPFLYGVVRNVALRFETRRARATAGTADLDDIAAVEASLSRVFDRAWARAIMKQAGELQADNARQVGPAATRRVELLRLRFQEGLPIRAIAARWQIDAAVLHHEYARARQEFKAALLTVVAFHKDGDATDLEQECAQLLALLG